MSFCKSCNSFGAPALAPGAFMHESERLNLYLYPDELDYRRRTPLAPSWHRIDSCVRDVAERFTVPNELGGRGALIYLSLGSLGSADVELMMRLVDLLSDVPHRFIVSKGPQHTEFELADNMWGTELVPQPAILPHVDLVITHAGNNTTTEALHFGKPMVALPLFWDQYDNAQRIAEAGVGTRLSTYECAADELLGTIDRLLADTAVRDRTAAVGRRLRADSGRDRAATLIEQLAASPD